MSNSPGLIRVALTFLFGSLMISFLLFSAPRSAEANDCPTETWNGGSGDDKFAGHDTHDIADGNDGSDQVLGWNCHDTVRGGPGPDDMMGHEGTDDVYGGGGHENSSHCSTFNYWCGGLNGGIGAGDYVYGGAGNDLARDVSAGADWVYGQGDNDVVDVEDSDLYDSADGGAGTDTCWVNGQVEHTGGCESLQ